MRPTLIPIVAGLALGAAGCTSPLSVQTERDLRRSVLDSVRREVADARLYPEPLAVERGPGIERLKLRPELVPELERMAGPSSYDRSDIPMDPDLLGQSQGVLPVTIEQSIKAAVRNNLQVQFARLQPAIAEAQVVAAQAAFDWTLFNNFDFNNLDQPRTVTTSFMSPFDQRQTVGNATGLRRNLSSGGQFQVQQDIGYTDIHTPGLNATPNPTRDLGIILRVDQPLLRNFGSDVALSQVRLNRNAERDQIAALKRDLIATVTNTEQAYWRLVQAQRDLLILQRLYERGVRTRDQVIAREILEATPAQIADARARVERREADVLRARNALRTASDSLKVLINDPEATIGSEVLMVPVDDTIDAPITFSLIDLLTTAIRSRPEVQQAIISIDNTSIRQQVADNARLPRLDLRLQTRISGQDGNLSGAYEQLIDSDFVDYLVGVQFEQPLGNRAAEAAFRQRRLERMQATIAYRNTIQQVILQVKQALRNVATNYQLIQQTRVARYAAAENLRSFEVEMQLTAGFTVVNLDLQFSRQEALASAEREEAQALTDYQASLAQLYSSIGTALERNRISFQVPDANEPPEEGGLDTPRNPIVPPADETPFIAPPTPRSSWGAEAR